MESVKLWFSLHCYQIQYVIVSANFQRCLFISKLQFAAMGSAFLSICSYEHMLYQPWDYFLWAYVVTTCLFNSESTFFISKVVRPATFLFQRLSGLRHLGSIILGRLSLILIRWLSAFDSTVISIFDSMVIRPQIIINFKSAFFINFSFISIFVSVMSLEQWISMLPAMSLEQWISVLELVCYKQWISYEFRATNIVTMNQFGAMSLYHLRHPLISMLQKVCQYVMSQKEQWVWLSMLQRVIFVSPAYILESVC